MPVPCACGDWLSSKKNRGSPSSVLRTALCEKMNEVPTKLPGPVAAAFGLAGVEQDQVVARFGLGVIAIGGVEVADVVRRVVERRGTERSNRHAGDRRRRGADQLDPRRPEERHREVTGQVDAFVVEADVHREGLDQVLAVVAVVERARAEEQRHRRIDRRRRPPVPRHPQPDAWPGPRR